MSDYGKIKFSTFLVIQQYNIRHFHLSSGNAMQMDFERICDIANTNCRNEKPTKATKQQSSIDGSGVGGQHQKYKLQEHRIKAQCFRYSFSSTNKYIQWDDCQYECTRMAKWRVERKKFSNLKHVLSVGSVILENY